MLEPRDEHLGEQPAVLLQDGQVLVMGGSNGSTTLSSAELYNPAAGKFTATGDMGVVRTDFTATALSNGDALITGGEIAGAATSSAELFDPGIGTFSPTGSMNVPRVSQTATLLQDGQVLVAGGAPFNLSGGSAELYNPATGTFTNTASMAFPHYGPLAGLLPDGRVVSVCNISDPGVDPCGAELYNPATGTWSDAGIAESTAQGGYTRTTLDNGQVLISGGASQSGGDKHLKTTLSSLASLFDPTTGNATLTGSMSIPRDGHTLTLLPNGQVLAAGGYTQSNSNVNPKISVTASAELFAP